MPSCPPSTWAHARAKDWSLKPGRRDYRLQQRIFNVVSARDPRRAQMPNCGEPGITGHPNLCRHPGCRVCLAVERQAQQRRARSRFAGLERTRLRFPTLLLGATSDLSGAVPMLDRFKADYAAAVRRLRRRDPRWEGVSIMAVMEVVMHRENEVHALSSAMRRFLAEVDAPVSHFGAPVWLVHVHALVHLGEVSEDEFRRVLTDILRGHRAVHLEAIRPHGTVAEQVTKIMGYAHKPSLLRRDPMSGYGWAEYDDEELAEYVAWCGTPAGRFPKRRFHFGASRAWKARMADLQVSGTLLHDDAPDSSHGREAGLTDYPCPIGTAPPRTGVAALGLPFESAPPGGIVPATSAGSRGAAVIDVTGSVWPRRPGFSAAVPRRVPQTRGLAKKMPLTHWISGKSNREASRLGGALKRFQPRSSRGPPFRITH